MADEAGDRCGCARDGDTLRVLILGAGAVGSYLGARLLSGGADVQFLARGARLAILSSSGLVVKSPLGNFSGRVKAAVVPPSDFVADVAVIACKAPALEGAIVTLAPYLGQGTRVLPVLNGVAHIDALGRRFPRANVLGGLTHGALTLRDDGVVEHMTPFLSTLVGSLAGAPDPVADRFVAALVGVGVDARASENIRQDMWDKLVFLATLAGATCLMRASVGTIVSTEDGEDFILALLAESSAVAAAEGFAPNAAAMASYRKSLTERGSPFTASMLRDIVGKRRTEADHILGDMLRRARGHNIDTPMLRIAHTHLQCHEAQLA